MSLWAIVPVKPLRRGKSRLSEILSEEERARLNHFLFFHTIDILLEVESISEILVISRDSNVLTMARDKGVRTVTENGAQELNNALLRASIFAQVFSSEGVLIVPADLPLLRPVDVSDFLALRKEPPTMVISPDRRRMGTNLMLINPADLISFSFGMESFERHCSLAKQNGAEVIVYENSRIALDLDIPEDYEILQSSNALPVLN
ncbi:MAG: 2-phospho-L-lactate guanylyltransferase [Chloroflexi bacterium]|nr:2-phospho-L-lactate guanylyltransferase [Chloroflexota bacterium]